MSEQTQLQQVTTKDQKKVEAGKRLVQWNHRKREEHAQLAEAQSNPKLTYYGAGAVVVIGMLGVLGYYVYQSKETPKETLVRQTDETTANQLDVTPAHKFEME